MKSLILLLTWVNPLQTFNHSRTAEEKQGRHTTVQNRVTFTAFQKVNLGINQEFKQEHVTAAVWLWGKSALVIPFT